MPAVFVSTAKPIFVIRVPYSIPVEEWGKIKNESDLEGKFVDYHLLFVTSPNEDFTFELYAPGVEIPKEDFEALKERIEELKK